MRPTDTIKAAFALPFRAIGFGASFLIRGRLLNQQTGAILQSHGNTDRGLRPVTRGF